MEPWLVELEAGREEAAWDAFLDRYRRLVFAAIRHHVQDHDDVMDVFTWVCEALRENGLRRLRAYTVQTEHRARFSTWLVVVVRNLCVDWLRERHGRVRPPVVVERLSPLQRCIYEEVFTARRSHAEAYELIRSRDEPELGFGDFLKELALVYRAVGDGRGRRSRDGCVPPPASLHAQPSDRLGAEETRDALRRALSCLHAVDRAAIRMYVIDELPAGEVARVLGLPSAKTVYNRVYRAMASVRRELERAGLGADDL